MITNTCSLYLPLQCVQTYTPSYTTDTFSAHFMHIYTHTQAAGAPSALSLLLKSFPLSVVNWAFSECWPVCHCRSQNPDTLCAQWESEEGGTKSLWIIPLARIPRQCDDQPESSLALCQGAKVDATITSGSGGYSENTTGLVVCHKHPTISASLKHLLVSQSYY